MSGFTLNLNVDVNVNDLLRQIAGFAPSSYNDRYPDGGRWISVQSDGIVISAYFHPTKWHSATVKTGFRHDRVAKSEAPPGKWAVAQIKRDIFGGDQTFYNLW